MAEVKPAEFARICGVAPSVISRKMKNGTLIRNAAGFLDTENPVNSRYASRRRLKSNNKALEVVDGEAAKKPPPVDFSVMILKLPNMPDSPSASWGSPSGNL
jgi:hypothetical protein